MRVKNPVSPDDSGLRFAGFPKEFERNFWETFIQDRHYYSILLTILVIFYGLAFIMAGRDWQMSEAEISKLRQRIIERVYDVELLIPEENVPKEEMAVAATSPEETKIPEEGIDKPKETPKQESQVQKTERRKRSRIDVEKRSREIQSEVASEGILAVATAVGSGVSGDVAYGNVLGGLEDAGGFTDINKIVGSTSGIRTATSASERTRGIKGGSGRKEGNNVGIDGLISNKTVSEKSAKFKRRGKVKLASKNVKLTSGKGSRNPESITTAINKQSALIEYCYKQRLKVNPNLRGRIDLEIEIAATGKVVRARIVKSTLGDRKLDACILRNVKRWRFSAVRSGTSRIRVPFIF